MSWAGISIASTVLIGRDLGEGKYKNAKLQSIWTIAVGAAVGLFQILIILFLHYFIFRAYTNNEEIIDILNTFLVIIFLQTFLDHIQGSLKGVFKALGMQNIASYILIFSYWVIGSISFYMFGFYFDMRLKGLWIGFSFATFIWTIMYLVLVYRIDWKSEWKTTLKRIENEIKCK